MYGTRDLRLEEFELPQIKDDEILVKIMSDSICTVSYTHLYGYLSICFRSVCKRSDSA